MASTNSLDEIELIATLLHDVSLARADVFSHTAMEKTVSIVRSRTRSEGISFLTKTLPKLGKMLDIALVDGCLAGISDLRFATEPESELPLFMGEFFSEVFDKRGKLLPSPCVESVCVLRQVLYLFYKYELPYTAEQEHEVISQFEKTEDDLAIVDVHLREIRDELHQLPSATKRGVTASMLTVAREARYALQKVFSHFDPTDIVPCHGPGAVATKQQLWAKHEWTNVSSRISQMYPLDAYFCASLGHVCDEYGHGFSVSDKCLPARVCLVPKDSRGPRLISSEPVDFQWIQGGLRKAIVALVERHPLTRDHVRFTTQEFNRQYAQYGSVDGNVATLDLKEASDRVSLELVRLLFPEHICAYLESCRSLATVLPCGRELLLRKFAPMGSSLCFPIMALTIWALLYAAAPDEDTRKRVLVYGDDVIVPRGYSRDAIETLEAFGLLVNASKSCTKGLFRESCGLDAFRGFEVTPLRLRTVWSSSRSPDVYSSWISYANSFYDMHCYRTYEYIVSGLHAIYGAIPDGSMRLACPSLRVVEQQWLPRKSRTNHHLQKREWRVWDIKAPSIMHELSGWKMLLRYFSEGATTQSDDPIPTKALGQFISTEPFRVRSYTRRATSMLVKRWR